MGCVLADDVVAGLAGRFGVDRNRLDHSGGGVRLTSFWKNDFPSMPSGCRCRDIGRSRRCGKDHRRDVAVVVDQVALRVAVVGPVDLSRLVRAGR